MKMNVNAIGGCVELKYKDLASYKKDAEGAHLAPGPGPKKWHFVNKITAKSLCKRGALREALGIPETPWAVVSVDNLSNLEVQYFEAAVAEFEKVQNLTSVEAAQSGVANQPPKPTNYASLFPSPDPRIVNSSSMQSQQADLYASRVRIGNPESGHVTSDGHNAVTREELEAKAKEIMALKLKLELQETTIYELKLAKDKLEEDLLQKDTDLQQRDLEVKRLVSENHEKAGELKVYERWIEKHTEKADEAREAKKRAEKKLEVTAQSLIGRALLDDFTNYLRTSHIASSASTSPNTPGQIQDDTSRRYLLQECTCTSCATAFREIHTNIVQTFNLVDAFTLKQMRKVLVDCFDRFSKVAHPMEKTPIVLEAFNDDYVKHVLWGVAGNRGWKTVGR
ncbi:hypothetical protein HK097_004824 [Rhizophlyctis rosea]|uniref:Uncharacterized protein n=1 Tax=Rhizophlyctis rosea TaxID=64517 RepID=A0AAD5X2N7_9FUNG|nr:hypothetical protein HK097_004824 [Rhizophlyctis rosea]